MDKQTADYLNAEVETRITCGAFSATFSNITIPNDINIADAPTASAAMRILADDSFKIFDGLISVSTSTSYSKFNSPSMQRREIDKLLLDPGFLSRVEEIGINQSELFKWPSTEVATEQETMEFYESLWDRYTNQMQRNYILVNSAFEPEDMFSMSASYTKEAAAAIEQRNTYLCKLVLIMK